MNFQASNHHPIGIFDSGIGGLTVANAIIKALPNEQIIYFGDSAHLPYGDKSADAIRYYCLKIVKFFLEQNCKLVIIACNSASSAGYKVLIEFFNDQTLFVNVVDPLVEFVAQQNLKKVGVIGTKATIGSGIYSQQLLHLRPDLQIHALATPLLVPMIEEGFIKNEVSEVILSNYLNRPPFQDIDALLLACTHYPLIKPAIASFFDTKVQIVDSINPVVHKVKAKLTEYQLLSPSRQADHQFYVSDYTKSFEETARLFFQNEVSLAYYPMW